MSVLIINMTARPEKRQELLQTLHDLTDVMRQEPGFCEARIGIDAHNRNRVTFTETWTTTQAAEAYMQQSEYFQVLCGALTILTSAAQIEFGPHDGVNQHNRRENTYV